MYIYIYIPFRFSASIFTNHTNILLPIPSNKKSVRLRCFLPEIDPPLPWKTSLLVMGTHLRRILRCWALVRRRKLKNIARRKESSHRSCEDVRPPSPSRLFKRYLAQEFWWTFGDGRVVSTVFFLENIWVLWDKVEVSVGFPLSCKGCTEMPFWNGLFSFFSFCERRLELTEFGVWQKRQGVSQQGRFNIYICIHIHIYVFMYDWLQEKSSRRWRHFWGASF